MDRIWRSSGSTERPYQLRSDLVQAICPSPKRNLQRLILRLGLKTGLDIGCGSGSLLTAVRSATFRSTGIDASPECIERCRSADIHDEYICADFRTMPLDRTFDVVVLSHVIEHFTRDEGMDVLRCVEALAKHLVYVETPFGFLEQTDYDGNPFQRHLSGWFPADFRARGYTVFGSGPRGLTRPMGKPRFLPGPMVRTIGRCAQWFYFRRPERASTIAAIRYTDEYGNIRSL